MKYYKFLTADNKGKYSEYDFTKYLPNDDKPGKWLRKIDNPVLCEKGYHCFMPEHILEWIEAQLFEVEINGRHVHGDDKTVTQQMRFIRKVDTWNDKTARLFACYCARDTLPILEKKYPNDNRPRVAIETAERYANGEATIEELNAARAAASDAASDAVWDAARAAARAAAWAAAWDAAGAAAWDAAGAASWAAARAALAETVRDLITPEQYELLAGPWNTVIADGE